MTELADKLMQCYDSRELPSWYEIYDASTRIATLSRQLAEARGVIERQRTVSDEMVDAALKSWCENGHLSIYADRMRRALRKAIEAAHAAAMGTKS